MNIMHIRVSIVYISVSIVYMSVSIVYISQALSYSAHTRTNQIACAMGRSREQIYCELIETPIPIFPFLKFFGFHLFPVCYMITC